MTQSGNDTQWPYGRPSDPPYAQQPHTQQPYGQQPYGAAYPPPPPYPQHGVALNAVGYPQPITRSNGMAVAGFVCGLVGLLIFSVALGPLAIIFGSIGVSRANAGASHKTLAAWAIGLGIFDAVVGVILLAVLANRGVAY